jgi:sporulation protein YlmC with PRC-barrel domain
LSRKNTAAAIEVILSVTPASSLTSKLRVIVISLFQREDKSMARYGMLRDYRFQEAAEDIRGSKLYGVNDEKLGKIDDVIFDHFTGVISYIVVDTGWLTTKKFIVPADRLRASTEHKDDFAVDLTKDQVEALPPYDETNLESEQQWADYEGRYRSKWEADPIMHRVGTDRNITPTTQQMEGNSTPVRPVDSAAGRVAADIDGTDTDALTQGGFAASTDSVVISQGAMGIGPRWDTFQDRLRERRKEVINTGSTEEGADKYRKAG